MNLLKDCSPTVLALFATLFCWLLTALGAATVFLFGRVNKALLSAMLGFSSGIMIAASFWSLLSPAIELAKDSFLPAYIVAASGFIFGAFFTLASDAVLSKLHSEKATPKNKKRLFLLAGAITIHNIPEGLAVGVAFGTLANTHITSAAFAAAASVAFGIALQNFPEGAAVSIPMREAGMSRAKSFFWGQFSGMAEPIAGVLGALLVSYITPILPFALSFAAGAMIYVVAEELIPEAKASSSKYIAALGCTAGFTVMMILDVALS